MRTDEVIGAILCGGGGTRMGGVEKPLTLFDGQPLVAHVRARLAPQVSRVVISANRESAAYERWGDEVIADDFVDGGPAFGQPTHGGPLYGIRAVMRALLRAPTRTLPAGSSSPLVMFCPGDAPLLDAALVARLQLAMHATTADAVYPHDGERAQHLFVLLRLTPAVASSLDAFLASDARAVHGWLEQCRATSVDASDIAMSFANVNTRQELDDLARHRPGSWDATG